MRTIVVSAVGAATVAAFSGFGWVGFWAVGVAIFLLTAFLLAVGLPPGPSVGETPWGQLLLGVGVGGVGLLIFYRAEPVALAVGIVALFLLPVGVSIERRARRRREQLLLSVQEADSDAASDAASQPESHGWQ